MSGLQFFDRLKLHTRNLPCGAVCRLHPHHYKDMLKLTAIELLDRGYGPKTATWAAPRHGDTSRLEWTFGLRFVPDWNVPQIG